MLTIIAKILKYKELILIGGIIVLVVLLSSVIRANFALKNNIERISDNFAEIQKDNYEIKLTNKEFKQLLIESKDANIRRIDSIIKANKIKPNYITEVNNVYYHYKDTNIVSIPTVELKSKDVKIGDECWGFIGRLNSDSLVIKDKWANSNIDLIEHMIPKKFLFIRIGWKRSKISAFSSCGETTINTIQVKKEY